MDFNRNLKAGEEIVYSTTLHWIRYFRVFSVFLVSFLVFEGWVGAAIASSIIALIYGKWTKWIIKHSTFIVTNDRTLLLMGDGPEIEILHSSNEEIRIRQDIIGEWLDYGVIVVVGRLREENHTGSIKHPYDLLKAIKEEKHNLYLLSQVIR